MNKFQLSRSISHVRLEFQLGKGRKSSNNRTSDLRLFADSSNMRSRRSVMKSESLRRIHSVKKPEIQSCERLLSYKLDAVKLLDSRVKMFLNKHFHLWKRSLRDTILVQPRKPIVLKTKIDKPIALNVPLKILSFKNESSKVDQSSFRTQEMTPENKFKDTNPCNDAQSLSKVLKKISLQLKANAFNALKANIHDMKTISLQLVLESFLFRRTRLFFQRYQRVKDKHILYQKAKIHAISKGAKRLSVYYRASKAKAFRVWSRHIENKSKKSVLVKMMVSILDKHLNSRKQASWYKCLLHIHIK